MILGPMAEQALRQALTISEGNWMVFVTRPGSLAILLVAVAALLGPRLYGVWARRRAG
jgi:putative tricarboxylic transport membrane protein